MKLCPICRNEMNFSFVDQVLNRYQVKYFQCDTCDLVQTEKPYWLSEAYINAISISDTGLIQRNYIIASKLTVLLHFCFGSKNTYVDVAGGYGMLTRLMRDRGIDYYWDDIYCENLFAQGFEASQAKQPYAALTAFEALEHIEDPLNFVSSCLAKYQCRTIIFTTELFRGNEAPKNDWWYYSFPTGQHISFFNLKTLEKLANELQLKFYSISGLHIFTDRSLNFLPFLALLTRSNIAPLIAILVKKRLGSRTQADSQMLLKISR